MRGSAKIPDVASAHPGYQYYTATLAEMMGIASLHPSYGKTKGAPFGAPFAFLAQLSAENPAENHCE
jgi:hypothetical protein